MIRLSYLDPPMSRLPSAPERFRGISLGVIGQAVPSPLKLKVQGDRRDQPTMATQITASVIATQNHVMNSTTCKRKAPLRKRRERGPFSVSAAKSRNEADRHVGELIALTGDYRMARAAFAEGRGVVREVASR
jgi:hypothetical protein